MGNWVPVSCYHNIHWQPEILNPEVENRRQRWATRGLEADAQSWKDFYKQGVYTPVFAVIQFWGAPEGPVAESVQLWRSEATFLPLSSKSRQKRLSAFDFQYGFQKTCKVPLRMGRRSHWVFYFTAQVLFNNMGSVAEASTCTL